MPSTIIVIGHRNPDNDAISSAVAYAYLKNAVAARDAADGCESDRYVPARLGPLPPETAGVFGRCGIEAPRMIGHVHARVSDVMTRNPVSINRHATLLEAGRMLRKHNIRALIVTNDDGTYRGLVTTRMIAERYISATDVLTQGSSQDAVAADLIASLDQTVDEILETEVLVLDAEVILKEAIDDLMASPLREAVVLDDDGRAIGIVTRSDVAVRPHRKVILVDHNERRQAAPGIDEAEVVEIIDHHRIADVSTVNPIRFLNLPVGSSATIVTMEFQREGIQIPEPIAQILLSALMTDTVILKSPTATPTDERVAGYLGEILGVDPIEFGMGVFKLRGGDEHMPIDKFVGADAKEFQVGDSVVLIAQHETVDLRSSLAREQEIRTEMQRLLEAGKYEFVLLMVTDIIAEGSQFLCEGNRKLLNRAFGISCTGKGGTWMPGVLSRKKQVAARILGS
ncbi:inorganic pyrophosphatase [Berryella intestinalis]|uniref:Inorganic pyrophosphatase n=1 Tax=Berryella intestinalis TaxID=1531429 RepID=A0A0A8B338_9ACTN|nr:putative manganese-dependent inorganic diphosphatase [Berryella intestinalis]AJC11784.1 inorganic pyrophosphatase [Berryella intestinalis]